MDLTGQTFAILALATIIGFAAALWPLRAFLKEAGAAKGDAALIATTAGVALALGVYLATGAPGLADAPFAARIAALEGAARTAPQNLGNEEMLAILAARARAAPKDPQPHYFSGVIHAAEARFPEAARAFDAALRRDPANGAVMVELGAAMVAMNDRIVTPEALALFVEAEKRMPDDVRPVFYQALAASQNGEKEKARKLWPRVLSMLPPDDPRRQMATMMLAEARS
jgi:cytochrome c-type biogenesis protein CcmH